MRSFQLFHKGVLVSCAFFAVTSSLNVMAAGGRRTYEEENNTLLREMTDGLSDIKHQVRNHESEIRTFEEKLSSQEVIMESIRDQLSTASQAHKDFLKDSSNTLEEKMGTLESTTKGLVSDLKQLKTHANDTATALGQYKQKLAELEKLIESQNNHLTALESALRSVMEAVQAGDQNAISPPIAAPGGKTYRVQPGDTLDKIASKHGTTIKALKDANGLTNDKIIVGKNLRIP